MIKKNSTIIFIILLLVSCATNEKKESTSTASQDSNMRDIFMFIGTYTSLEGSKGIYVHKFNTNTGISDSVSMVEVANPSYLTIRHDNKRVYAVGENNNIEDSYAHAFSFDIESGTLQMLNSQLTHGSSPAFITLDRKGNNVITANYGGGSITQFSVDSEGALNPMSYLYQFKGKGKDSVRQQQPHLHSVQYSPDGMFLFATDLGTDKIYRYRSINSVFEGQPALLQSDSMVFITPSGTGPRHFDFHPNGLHFYLIGELSGEVIVYDYNMGDLQQKQKIVADSVGAQGSADIHVAPNGKFLYVSNRLKEDGIAIFKISSKDGTLTKVGYQTTAKHPRSFAISPNGKFLLVASRDENVIEVYNINKETGLLTNTHQDILIHSPVCIKFAHYNN